MVLGTAQLGQEYGIHNRAGKPSEEMAYRILDCAWRHGIHMLDTAGAYGDAEKLIGKYQEATGHAFRICTKLSADTVDGMDGELEGSIRKLGCRQVWLYYLHCFEASKNRGVMQKMEKWKLQGRIEKVGISVYEPKELEYVVEQLPDAVDVIQIPFHLLDNVRWMEVELLQRARERGIQIFARSVFLQGLFFQNPNTEAAKALCAREALLWLHQLAGEYSMSIQQLAISFVACHPCIDEFLLGCETVGQLMQNIALEEAAGKERLADGILDKIADISRKANGIAIDPRKWKGRFPCA